MNRQENPKTPIEDLNKYDFPLHGIPDLIYMFTVCYMFLTIKKP